MNILPAIDLYKKKAVRLLKGDYNNLTVYSENPVSVALDFERAGAKYIHIVDLEGAKEGTTPNIDVVEEIVKNTSLFVEIGGGIRSYETIKKYFDIGVSRVILGTAAVTDDELLSRAIGDFGKKIAVGADIKDGYVAIKGWLEKSVYTLDEFAEKMQNLGVKTLICTDISKDGVMNGTNLVMYRELVSKYSLDIIASGGVSTQDDIIALRNMNVSGAIIGKAYYTGAIDLTEAIEVAK